MLNRKGFTLIELLIVVVIIGILAAIAIPKFASTKEKAYIASMKADLRNLVTAQESYFADNNLYANTGDLTAAEYGTSAGVTVAMTANSGMGWAATSTHTGTTQSCAIYNGTPTAVPTPTPNQGGEPECA